MKCRRSVARRPVDRRPSAAGDDGGLRNCFPHRDFVSGPAEREHESDPPPLLVRDDEDNRFQGLDDEYDDDFRRQPPDRRDRNSQVGCPGDPALHLTAAGRVADALGMSDQPGGFDIPEEFWSAYAEEPFASCIDCGALLTDASLPYAIQKHFVAGEAVFEMAMCMECAARLQEQFSQASRQTLQDQIRLAPERIRRQQEAEQDPEIELTSAEELHSQLQQVERRHRVRLERAMAACALCGTPRTECHRYSLGTACLGLSLLSAAPEADNLGSPFLICENCELSLNECLSQQTRDAWNRFVEETFDGPPSLAVDPREVVAMF